MKWIKFNQKEKLILASIALVAFFAAYHTFILKPLVDNKTWLAAENREKAGKLSQASEIDKLLREITLDNEMYETRLNSYTDRIPASFNIPDILVNIGDICSTRGLDELFFIPDEPAPGETYTALSISIGVRGPFPEVVNMLGDLEHILPIVLIKEFEIGKADTKTETVEARISFVIYSTGTQDESEFYVNRGRDIRFNPGRKDPFFR